MIRKIKRFFTQIANIFYYLPAIWKSFDWDYSYLEELMYLKMKKMHKRLEKDAKELFRDEANTVKSLKLALKILERRRTYWYSGLTEKYHKNMSNEFIPVEFEGEECFEWIIKHSSKEEEEQYHEAIRAGNKTEKRDWKIFCQIMEKYFHTWWS
jgi:hypothetical protein